MKIQRKNAVKRLAMALAVVGGMSFAVGGASFAQTEKGRTDITGDSGGGTASGCPTGCKANGTGCYCYKYYPTLRKP